MKYCLPSAQRSGLLLNKNNFSVPTESAMCLVIYKLSGNEDLGDDAYLYAFSFS